MVDVRFKYWGITPVAIWQAALVGNMKWILRSDWLPARARRAYLALSRFETAQEKKNRVGWTNKLGGFKSGSLEVSEDSQNEKKGMNEFCEFIVPSKL